MLAASAQCASEVGFRGIADMQFLVQYGPLPRVVEQPRRVSCPDTSRPLEGLESAMARERGIYPTGSRGPFAAQLYSRCTSTRFKAAVILHPDRPM